MQSPICYFTLCDFFVFFRSFAPKTRVLSPIVVNVVAPEQQLTLHALIRTYEGILLRGKLPLTNTWYYRTPGDGKVPRVACSSSLGMTSAEEFVLSVSVAIDDSTDCSPSPTAVARIRCRRAQKSTPSRPTTRYNANAQLTSTQLTTTLAMNLLK